MSIHYRQYTDTLSILNYLQNYHLWRKKGQKFVLYYPENHWRIHLGLTCAIFASKTLSRRLPSNSVAAPFSIRVTSCQYELAVIFFHVICVSTLPWIHRHVVSFREYFDNRYFRQSITALVPCAFLPARPELCLLFSHLKYIILIPFRELMWCF